MKIHTDANVMNEMGQAYFYVKNTSNVLIFTKNWKKKACRMKEHFILWH